MHIIDRLGSAVPQAPNAGATLKLKQESVSFPQADLASGGRSASSWA
jgi:hypothetical protein